MKRLHQMVIDYTGSLMIYFYPTFVRFNPFSYILIERMSASFAIYETWI
ncbi:hypothetical protein [Thalassobacillus sp. B23F22_16]